MTFIPDHLVMAWRGVARLHPEALGLTAEFPRLCCGASVSSVKSQSETKSAGTDSESWEI